VLADRLAGVFDFVVQVQHVNNVQRKWMAVSLGGL